MGLHRLLGQGTLPKQYADKLGTLPKPVPLKEFLAKTITRNEEVQLSTVKRSQLAELLERIFVADPAKRISLESAANHPFITSPDV